MFSQYLAWEVNQILRCDRYRLTKRLKNPAALLLRALVLSLEMLQELPLLTQDFGLKRVNLRRGFSLMLPDFSRSISLTPLALPSAFRKAKGQPLDHLY
ncbi:MAG: hypothetical protein PUP93_10895 [Rhizonema sp. NSF051]|nr:hypothetical protein [Rhizonema sp. NSF051]